VPRDSEDLPRQEWPRTVCKPSAQNPHLNPLRMMIEASHLFCPNVHHLTRHKGEAKGAQFRHRVLSDGRIVRFATEDWGQNSTLCIDAGSYRHEDRPIVGPVFDVLVWVQLTADFS